jgi:hypothetical protein
MARVEVHGGKVEDGRIASLDVRMHHLPPRTIDRDTALAWMRDGHSFIPVVDGRERPALMLREIPGEGELPDHVIRDDTENTPQDSLPFG